MALRQCLGRLLMALASFSCLGARPPSATSVDFHESGSGEDSLEFRVDEPAVLAGDTLRIAVRVTNRTKRPLHFLSPDVLRERWGAACIASYSAPGSVQANRVAVTRSFGVGDSHGVCAIENPRPVTLRGGESRVFKTALLVRNLEGALGLGVVFRCNRYTPDLQACLAGEAYSGVADLHLAPVGGPLVPRRP
jgi:hypothetical protein